VIENRVARVGQCIQRARTRNVGCEAAEKRLACARKDVRRRVDGCIQRGGLAVNAWLR
jgi:hypothetical protein